jgi:WD40 repeat protein
MAGRCLRVLQGHLGHILSLAITSDGRWVLSWGADYTIRVWNLQSGTCVHTHGTSLAISKMALAHNGLKALVSYADGRIVCHRLVWSLMFADGHAAKSTFHLDMISQLDDGRWKLGP